VGMGPQERAFRQGVDVLVATPGRLLDHFRSGYARLADLEHLVLDEADRMLDMGFLPDIKRILRHLPARRQTLFFSATLPAPIERLTRELLRDPEVVRLSARPKPASGITQSVYPVAQELKATLLAELLRSGGVRDALVFTRTKHRANRLATYLEREGFETARIHSNRSQAQRTAALAGFKSGRYRVLVATDIAARGIDVTELGHVVNFDVPNAPEDYVHRVGRTGRAEARGEAVTFVAPAEEAELGRIERVLGQRLPRVEWPGLAEAARRGARPEAAREERRAPRHRPRAGGSGRSGVSRPRRRAGRASYR